MPSWSDTAGVVASEGVGPAHEDVLVGRDAEIELVRGLLAEGGQGARGLVLCGSAGIGKSTVWSRALDEGRVLGYRVLACRPVGAEVRLAFAALGDLVEPLAESLLPLLAAPRRLALEIALLRREGPMVGARAIGVSLLDVLRRLAADGPLLIGIDDLQWLDSPSAHALEFALRRLDRERVAVVATERLDADTEPALLKLDEVLGAERVRRVRLGPLTVAALHELLRLRLGAALGRGALLRLHDASDGNPLVALELARELERRGEGMAPGESLPLSGSLRDLVGQHIAELPAPVRRVLLAAGALSQPSVVQLARLGKGALRALEQAEEAGVVEIGSDGVVRFTHPLLALVPYDDLAPTARRRLHRRLAEIAATPEERARHAALSVMRPDAQIAAALDAAALNAGARGAPEAAAELAGLAAGLTPPGAERWERVLAAAEWHERGGELVPAATRADEVIASRSASRSTRVRALTLLGTVRGDIEGVEVASGYYLQALEHARDLPALGAEVEQKLAWSRLVAGRAPAAARHARAAVRLAPRDEPSVAAAAAATAALVEAARTGRLPRRLLDRALALEQAARSTRPALWGETAPSVLEGVVSLWLGELEQARAPLEQAHRAAVESGDPWLLMHSLAYWSALETGSGEPRRGLELARRYLALAAETGQEPQRVAALWPLAAAASWLGQTEEVRTVTSEALAIAERTGQRLYAIGCLAALGDLELSLGAAVAAADALGRALQLAHDGGIVLVGRVSILPAAVEACVASGELGAAVAAAEELRAHATRIDRPWLSALADRAGGLVAAGERDLERARALLERALENHALQPRPLEQARTELARGAVLRQAGAKRDARLALEAAQAAFAAAGAEAWRERAARELGRIGGRRAPAGDKLSATESRIAELVAAGHTNAETARVLQLSARTVEWNLSKIYRKLSVRSRSELAATLRRG